MFVVLNVHEIEWADKYVFIAGKCIRQGWIQVTTLFWNCNGNYVSKWNYYVSNWNYYVSVQTSPRENYKAQSELRIN